MPNALVTPKALRSKSRTSSFGMLTGFSIRTKRAGRADASVTAGSRSTAMPPGAMSVPAMS